MTTLVRAILAICLLNGAPGTFGQEDDSPKLPDSYAEVVLSVEGMT